ncbi:hypothetical protein CLOP_g18183 [Closterium sp. NIES-67]|nr:hypothetical protein CLOP_g18183 [Closterium sp. NIES-67]
MGEGGGRVDPYAVRTDNAGSDNARSDKAAIKGGAAALIEGSTCTAAADCREGAAALGVEGERSAVTVSSGQQRSGVVWVRDYIEWLHQAGVKQDVVGRVAVRNPTILATPIHDLQARVDYLVNEVGVQREWIGVVLSKAPGVLVDPFDKLLAKGCLLHAVIEPLAAQQREQWEERERRERREGGGAREREEREEGEEREREGRMGDGREREGAELEREGSEWEVATRPAAAATAATPAATAAAKSAAGAAEETLLSSPTAESLTRFLPTLASQDVPASLRLPESFQQHPLPKSVGELAGTVVYNHPPVMSEADLPMEALQAKLAFFDSLHISGTSLAKVIVRRPQLLSSSLDATWQLLIRYLSLLGLTNVQIGEMVVRQPRVLQLTVQADVSPKVRFLRLIGVPEGEVAGVLHRYPPILTYSLDKKIRPLVRFLVAEAGVPDHEVWKVVVAKPDLVACQLDSRLRLLLRFLLSMGIVKEDVGSMVVQFPPLLKYNPAILKPKWRYFSRTMRLSVDHLVAFPRFFSYALDTRIAPRHRLLQQQGLSFSLRHMLCCSDALFLERVKWALEGRGEEGSGEESEVEEEEEEGEGDGEGEGEGEQEEAV